MNSKLYQWSVVFLALFFNHFSYAQSQEAEGVSFSLAGEFTPFNSKSLVPYLSGKVKEVLNTEKKVTVIYATGVSRGVIEILEEGLDNLKHEFRNVRRVTKVELLSNLLTDKTILYRSVYEAESRTAVGNGRLKGTIFNIEVVVGVADPKGESSNVGILYIITPSSKYFENRFLLSEIRKSLKVEPKKGVATEAASEKGAQPVN